MIHALLYAVTFALGASGVVTGARSAWPDYLRGQLAEAPALESLASRQAHGVLVFALIGLILRSHPPSRGWRDGPTGSSGRRHRTDGPVPAPSIIPPREGDAMMSMAASSFPRRVLDVVPKWEGISKEGVPGVGLGTFVVVGRIVEVHRGRIDVESMLGASSTLRVCIRVGDGAGFEERPPLH